MLLVRNNIPLNAHDSNLIPIKKKKKQSYTIIYGVCLKTGYFQIWMVYDHFPLWTIDIL